MCVVQLCDRYEIVEKGSVITLPEINEQRDGFLACGWTTGDSVEYRPGDKVTVDKDTYFYVRWKRTDMFAVMDLSR